MHAVFSEHSLQHLRNEIVNGNLNLTHHQMTTVSGISYCNILQDQKRWTQKSCTCRSGILKQGALPVARRTTSQSWERRNKSILPSAKQAVPDSLVTATQAFIRTSHTTLSSCPSPGRWTMYSRCSVFRASYAHATQSCLWRASPYRQLVLQQKTLNCCYAPSDIPAGRLAKLSDCNTNHLQSLQTYSSSCRIMMQVGRIAASASSLSL